MSRTAVLLPLAVAIGGSVVYHLGAKAVPKDVPPTLVLVAAYAVALLLSAGAWVLLPGAAAPAAALRMGHPAVLALGLGAFMIEIGYVTAYRTGFPISITSTLVNGATAAVLIPVGILLFSERLSPSRAIGLVLCVLGLWLLRR